MDVSAVVLIAFLLNASIPVYSRDLYPDLVVQAQVTPLTYSNLFSEQDHPSTIHLFTTQRRVLSYNTDLQQTPMSYYIVHVSHMCLLSYNHSRNADGLEQRNPRGQLQIVRARDFLHYVFYVLNHATCFSRELVAQEKRAPAENWRRYLKNKIQNQRPYVHTLRHHFTC